VAILAGPIGVMGSGTKYTLPVPLHGSSRLVEMGFGTP
jgi:hypothetical protein